MRLPLLVLLTIIAAQCATPKVTVGWEEERNHLISPVPVIRTKESRRVFESVPVRLTVDASGHVVSAEALDSSQFADRAVTVTKALRFWPFLRNGVAVEVQIEDDVRILPLERRPAQHVVFPDVDRLSSVTFSLNRTECFGSCPGYEVHITGDGLVTYAGTAFVAVKGNHTDHIPTEKVRELLEAFRQADFYSLEDRYIASVTDCPTYIVGIKIGNNAKNVTDYMGDRMGMPLAVSDLEQELDVISGAARWLRGNRDTVSSLRKESFDLKSAAAGLILTHVAASGDEEAVLSLIKAGAPIGIVDQMEATALASAAGSGKLRAVNLLIQRGADAKNPRVLMEAARSGSPAVVRRILQAGADAKANLPGIRLLLFSTVSFRGRTGDDVDRGSVVRLLVQAGADPNIRDSNRNIPLHGDLDEGAANALVDLGADVNAQNKDGETPLMWTSSEFVAGILLNAGADVSIRSRAGKTALDVARERHHSEIAELIEKASHSEK